jgi:hypothetical protein
MICKVRLLKIQIKICSYLAEIVTSSNKELKDFESDIVVRFCKLGNSYQETVARYLIVWENAGSSILTLELEVKKSN